MYDTSHHYSQYQDPVYPHEDNFYGAPTLQSHAGYRNAESTWSTRYAGHHEDQQNTHHYPSSANQLWDDLEDDGEALLRPPPPKHMQAQSNRLTVLSTITESSFAQPSVASVKASVNERAIVPHRGRSGWDTYQDSPTLDPQRGWEDAPPEWRNQISSGRVRYSASAESPPPRSTDHSLGSQGSRDRDSQGTPPSSSSRSNSQSTSPPSTPPQSKPYNGPKPFLPYGPCRPPARIPSDPSWIMTGGNAWAQGFREKYAVPKSSGPGAGSWGDEYRRQEQQQPKQTPSFFSSPGPTVPAAKSRPQPQPPPVAPSPKPQSQSHIPYGFPAHARAYQSYSSLPRPNAHPIPAMPSHPMPSHSMHPMAIWLPKGAASVPDSIHRHDTHPNTQQWEGMPGNDEDDDDDMYVSVSDDHGPGNALNEDDDTFVDEWDRVHSLSPRPQAQESVPINPYRQEPHQQQHTPVPQQNAWNVGQTEQDVWRNHHLGHSTSESQSGRGSQIGNYNQSYTSRWQHHQASDSNPIPVWRAASATGRHHPQDGPVVIAPSETTWVPPDTSWDPGDDSVAPWQLRAPSNNLTHLGPLRDLRTRHRPNVMVAPNPPEVPAKKPKQKWWKIFSKK